MGACVLRGVAVVFVSWMNILHFAEEFREQSENGNFSFIGKRLCNMYV